MDGIFHDQRFLLRNLETVEVDIEYPKILFNSFVKAARLNVGLVFRILGNVRERVETKKSQKSNLVTMDMSSAFFSTGNNSTPREYDLPPQGFGF